MRLLSLYHSDELFLRLAGGGEILTAVVEVLTVMIAGTSEGRDQALVTPPTTETISSSQSPRQLPTCSSGNAHIPESQTGN